MTKTTLHPPSATTSQSVVPDTLEETAPGERVFQGTISRPLPGPCEIALTGNVTTMIRPERQLMLGTTQLTQADGYSSAFSPAQSMLVVLPESTQIHLGHTGKRLPWTELNNGHTIHIIGIDQGAGRPIEARRVWVL